MDIIEVVIQVALLVACVVAVGALAFILLLLLVFRTGDGSGISRRNPDYWPLTIQTVLVAAAMTAMFFTAVFILLDLLGPTLK